MKKTRSFTKILSLILSVAMLFGMTPALSALAADSNGSVRKTSSHIETWTETVYEKYTPHKSGQYLDSGNYIIYNHSRNCVFAGQASSGGGITASTNFTITGNRIDAPGADVVSIVTVQGQTNRYYLKTSNGSYVSIGNSNARNGATLVSATTNNPPQLTATVNNNTDYVALGNTNGNHCLNAYSNSYFGVYQGALSNNENQLTLYRETTITHTEIVEGELVVPEGYHRATACETVYELYTPNTDGQIIEPGRYVFLNTGSNSVLAGKNAPHGGVTGTQNYTLNGERIVAAESDVLTVVGIDGQTNKYNIYNSEGQYISVYPAANQSAASMNAIPARLGARVVNGQVQICDEDLGYCLGAYTNTVFGVRAVGNNTNNQFRLYREVTYTYDIAVPDYPAEHAIDLSKEATEVGNFQETGLAKVDLSLTGIPPFYSAGVDVLFITDISNSMAWKSGTQRAPVSGETSKLQDMQSAVSAFTDAVMGPNEGSGMKGNNTVTFCTFGGWDADRNTNGSTHSQSYIDPTRTLITASSDSNAVKTAVNNITFNMTGSNEYYLSFDGRKYSDATHKGYGNTVYDYGFMEGYNAALDIKQTYEDETGESYDESGRQIFVIFISDGAPTNYNGYMYKEPGGPLKSGDGLYSDNNVNGTGGNYVIYNGYGNVSDIEARQQVWFDYISTHSNVWATKLFNLPQVAGMDTIGIDFLQGGFQAGKKNDQTVYWIFTPGSDMDLGYVLSSLVEGELISILTADDQSELANHLAEEAKRVSTLASYVSVDDRMGEQYRLQRESFILNPADGSQISLEEVYSVRPSITVSRYPTVHYVEGGANDHLGEITGDPTIMEKITFSDDGEQAFSTLINDSQTNIMTDSGVIRAHYFYYNTNEYDVDIDGLRIPAESFHWNVSNLMEDRLELSYYVKLKGSEDYSVPDGIYPTNEEAAVVYKDFQGRTIRDYFEKPDLPWSTQAYITIIKKWTDVTVDHDPINVKVLWEAPDGTQTDVTDTVTLSADNDWTAEILTDLSHLPDEGTYKAWDSVNGYYEISGELKPHLVEHNGNIYKTNHLEIVIYNTPEDLTSFDVTKTWSDIAVDDHADDPVEVELFCNGVTTGRTATLNKDNNWFYTFNDLPLAVDGVKAEYSAQEITQLEDYVSIPGPVVNVNAADIPANATVIDDGSKSGVIVYEDETGFAHAIVPAYEQTISNEIDADLLRLRIYKKWMGDESHDPITVSVGYRFNNGTTQTLRSGIVLSEDNDWNTLVSLHRPDGAGDYFLTEQNIPEGYVCEIGEMEFEGEHAAEVSVYNFIPDGALTSLTATKAWSDGAAQHAGEAIEVELCVNGEPSGSTAVLSADNDWTYTFEGLAVKDENGDAYSYSIRENTASAMYTASYSAVTTTAPAVPGYDLVVDGGTTDVSLFENESGDLVVAAPASSQTVTNTETQPDTVELIVNKQWMDSLSSHGPVSCVVGYEAADGSVTIVSKSFTLSADTDWSRKIEVAECDTATGRYVLLEPTVDGYEPVTGDLELVDTTVETDVYVPATTFEAGGEYIIMTTYNGNHYVFGADSRDGVILAKPVGSEFVTDSSIVVGNWRLYHYLTAAPAGNTVWTYTSNGTLVNNTFNRYLTGNTSSSNNLYLGTSGSPVSAVTETVWSSTYNQNIEVQFLKMTVNWIWGTRTRYVYYNGGSQFLTEADWHNSNTSFQLYKKETISTGGKSTGITATNIPKLGDQTVVIDYGLPVQVNVLDYYEAALGIEPTFVGMAAPGAEAFAATDTLPEGFNATSATYPHGQVAYANGKLTYTPTDMTMSEKDVVGLCFSLNVDGKTWYLYGSVTVVPATIMYYEDDFVVFEDTINNHWEVVTGANDGVYQGEDRPGIDEALAAIDADNVYGYDDANVNCTTYSNGKAHKVHVKNGDYAANGNKWPTATFTFSGTSFDLISVTARETGYIFIDVYEGTEAAGARYKRWVVDTYYGYTRARDGYIQHEWYWAGKWYVRNTIFHEGEELPEIPEDQILPANLTDADTSKTYKTYEINYTWVPSTNSGSLYQIPVIKSIDLPYNTYTVVVTCAYSTFFDHTAPVNPATGKKDYTNGNYDFYFDAVRTYAPAEDFEGYSKEYYTKDGEGWPQFIELRKNIISAADAVRGPKQLSGAIFFDSMAADKGEGSDLTDYQNYGPDNEVYLAPGQSISFALECKNNGKAIDTVQIGAKKLTGETVELKASHTAEDESVDMRTIEIIASSDMYYNVGEDLNWRDNVSDIVTLTNVGQATVSITNVKITYKEITGAKASLAPMNRRMLKRAASTGDAAYIASKSECFHRYEYTVTAEPTDTAPGVITAVCTDCGNTFEIEIPALTADVYEITGMFDATPEKDGWVEYTWKADENGVEASFRVVLPACGEYIWATGDGVDPDEFENDSDPGDTGDGEGDDLFSGVHKGLRGFLDRILAFFRMIIDYISKLFGKG